MIIFQLSEEEVSPEKILSRKPLNEGLDFIFAQNDGSVKEIYDRIAKDCAAGRVLILSVAALGIVLLLVARLYL